MSAVFLAAFYSQARVQTFGSSDVREKASKAMSLIVTSTEPAVRGQILTSDGKVLARDEGAYQLNIDFDSVPSSDAFFLDVSKASGVSGAEIIEFSRGEKRKRTWPQMLTSEQKRKVDEVKSRWRADGISCSGTGQRSYPMSWLTSSVVGLLGTEETSKGIEAKYQSVIAGKPGVSKGMRDRTGAFLPMRMEEGSVKRVDGSDIVLTLDSDLQRAAAESIRRAVEANKAQSGVAVILDPKTGDVLAMANWPTFDPSTRQGPSGEGSDLNQNVQARFEPGSTMKILTLAKALDAGAVTAGWTGQCSGSLVIGPYRVSCAYHNGSNAHGSVDLEKAIAQSCNVSAASWAVKVGYDDFRKFIDDIELLKVPNVGLPSEIRGEISNEPVAKTHDLMCWGFGQSMGVTPLALAGAFTALGNGGLEMKPRLIKSIGGKGNPISAGKRIFRPETAERVQEYMEQVISSSHGTGKALRIPGYRLGGKTGTAERIGRVGGGYVSNFVGFVPAIEPKAVVLVMIDRPTGPKHFGGEVAGPVFLELARSLIAKYNLPPASGTNTEVKVQAAPSVEVEVRPSNTKPATGRRP